MTRRFRPLKASTHTSHRLTCQARWIRPASSCRTPRLPMKVPRSGVAMISPKGVTRFGLGIGGGPHLLPFLDPLHILLAPAVEHRPDESEEAAERSQRVFDRGGTSEQTLRRTIPFPSRSRSCRVGIRSPTPGTLEPADQTT